ncbi:glycosyltransferase family 39 protein [Undibacterium curvum]|uniref:glycosyltransferase family 39 protein n=1 Tax=Undibacterium curvum TaxID=2762294 RepID=UPI003BF4A344
MNKSTSLSVPVLPLWLVWGFAVYFFGFWLGAYPVLNNNEGLYAEIPREMLASGDWRHWIIPHLNGLAYMEKPPLLYWLTALFMGIFGQSEWVIRLVPALSGLGCVGLILWFSKSVARPKAGRMAALIFVSGLGVTAMARVLMFDMLLTVFLMTAVMAAYLYTEKRKRKHLYLAAVALGLALLAKGFVALILFSAVLGVYLVLRATSFRDVLAGIGLWLDWRAIAVFLLVAAPWHIVAAATEPIFAWFYFINEHVLRFLGKREPHDYYAGAWWYYLPRVVIFLFPWSFLLPVLLFVRRVIPADKRLHLFLLAGWLMPLLFFSVSSAKANYYLVTVMPLMAMQIAFWLEEKGYGGKAGIVFPSALLMALFAAVAYRGWGQATSASAEVLAFGMGQNELTAWVGVIFLCASFLVMLIALIWPKAGVSTFVVIPMLGLPLLLNVAAGMGEKVSTRALVHWTQHALPQHEAVLYRVFEQQSSLPFYLQRVVRIVDIRSNDLYWGNKLHTNSVAIDDLSFADLLAERKVALLVLKEDLADFQNKPYAKKLTKTKELGDTLVFSN